MLFKLVRGPQAMSNTNIKNTTRHRISPSFTRHCTMTTNIEIVVQP